MDRVTNTGNVQRGGEEGKGGGGEGGRRGRGKEGKGEGGEGREGGEGFLKLGGGGDKIVTQTSCT